MVNSNIYVLYIKDLFQLTETNFLVSLIELNNSNKTCPRIRTHSPLPRATLDFKVNRLFCTVEHFLILLFSIYALEQMQTSSLADKRMYKIPNTSASSPQTTETLSLLGSKILSDPCLGTHFLKDLYSNYFNKTLKAIN